MEAGLILVTAIYLVKMMRFHCLASGSKGNAFLLEDGDTRILIDCGSTKQYLTQSFHKVGVDYTSIDALFITHQHSDHISQIKMFKNCAVYSYSDILDNPQQIFLVPFEKVQIKSLSITTLPLSHDAEKTVGFVIENANEKLVYITDTGYVNERNYGYLKDADYYIIESNHDVGMLMQSRRPHYIKSRILSDCGHLCNEDSASLMSKMVSFKTKAIILAHLSLEANDPLQAVSVMEETLTRCGCAMNPNLRIEVAQQFEILTGGINDDEETRGSCDSLNLGVECVFNS